MKKLLIILICCFFFTPSLSIDIIGKSIKCETQKKTIRGYPLYFFFENETNVKSFFISEENSIKFHNLNYKVVEQNFIEIRYVGKIEKRDLILTHTKGGRQYTCIFLTKEENIYKELGNFIGF